MGNNAIRKLHNDSFENCWYLEKIDLTRNGIEIIPVAIFMSVFNLKEIALVDNLLKYNDDCFPGNLFQHTSNLKLVSIQSYMMPNDLSLENLETMIKKLPDTLEELNINVPASDGFAVKFTNFKKLKKLGIYDFNYVTKFNTIANDTFKPLANSAIEELRIRAQNLHAVEPLAFSHFSKLTTLDMSETIGMSVADFYPAWTGLQQTQLKKLVLESMCKDFSKTLTSLNDTFFKEFNLPHLVDLHIGSAQITTIIYIRPNFTGLPKLENLNLSRNYMSMADLFWLSVKYLKHLSSLRELDISHQIGMTLGDMQPAKFNVPPNLVKLDMSNIRHEYINIPFEMFIGNPSKLQYFKFQENYIDNFKKFDVQEPGSKVKFVADFSRNGLSSFAGSFNKSILESGLRVSGLLLYDNKLGDELRDKGDFIFEHFKDLQSLDVSSNGIKNMPSTIFKSQNDLRYLNLGKNALLFLDFQISHLKYIQLIDVSDNLVSQFNKTLRDELDALRQSSPNLTLNLLGNPIQCSCETLASLGWMNQRQSMFISFEDYTCIQNDEVTKFKNIGQLLNSLDYQCSLNLIVKVSASLLAILIVVIAFSLFLYRHKWDVRFLCLKFIANRKAFQELDELETQYEYDAFVVYDKNDFEFVRNELYKNLDKKDGEDEVDNQTRFRLCFHERDFMPGATIEENVLKAIECSRKTIVVLSKNFLQSKWCEFELQMARIECVEKGRNLIVAVMLEHNDVMSMALSLVAFKD